MWHDSSLHMLPGAQSSSIREEAKMWQALETNLSKIASQSFLDHLMHACDMLCSVYDTISRGEVGEHKMLISQRHQNICHALGLHFVNYYMRPAAHGMGEEERLFPLAIHKWHPRRKRVFIKSRCSKGSTASCFFCKENERKWHQPGRTCRCQVASVKD